MSVNKSNIAVREIAQSYQFDYPYVRQVKTADGRPCRPAYIPSRNKQGYAVISFSRREHGIQMRVLVHRVVAYQKYGEQIFQPGLVCRHKNDDRADFSSDNILLGTQRENLMDIAPARRIKTAIKASSFLRVATDEQVAKIRADKASGMSYSELARKHGLSGKGTAHYIVNNLGRLTCGA